MGFATYQPNRPAIATLARSLRKAMTEPEKRLWWALRHRLPAHKFRRQFVVGRYIADFCCVDARLVVEVDGNQHGTDEAQAHDVHRTSQLATQGFRVIRFSNEDVMRSLDMVLDTILAAVSGQPVEMGRVEGPPPLAPPHKGEGNTRA